MKRFLLYSGLVLCLLAAPCLAQAPAAQEQVRPETWAKPMALEGVPNFHKVSDALYRSAQPTDEGMQNLEKMGIKTIVNLRSFHSDRGELKGTELDYEHITMKAWHPERKEIVRFLRIVGDTNRTPVLVHCQHGADRTGTVCAFYRIVVQDWTHEDAITEMTNGGFNFHAVWKNLPGFIKELDVDKIREEVSAKR